MPQTVQDQSFMKQRPILPLLLSMALPMVLSMLVNSLYNIVDSFFVARISEEAMTALSLVYPVQNFVNAAAIGFGVGMNALIAFHLGANRPDRADAAATIGMALSFVHGVVLAIVCTAILPGFCGFLRLRPPSPHSGLNTARLSLRLAPSSCLALRLKRFSRPLAG